MKNCEVTIKQFFNEKEKSVQYCFDDYRIAQALANILDNVSEPNFDQNPEDYLVWQPIVKKVI